METLWTLDKLDHFSSRISWTFTVNAGFFSGEFSWIPNWPWIRRILGRWPKNKLFVDYTVIHWFVKKTTVNTSTIIPYNPQLLFGNKPNYLCWESWYCTPLLLFFITYKSQFLLAGSWYFRWLYKTSCEKFWLLKSCEKSSFLLVKYEFLAGFDPHFCWSFWDSWPLTCSGRPARQQRGLRASLWHFGLGTLEGQRGSLIADNFRWGLIEWEYTISHIYIYIIFWLVVSNIFYVPLYIG